MVLKDYDDYYCYLFHGKMADNLNNSGKRRSVPKRQKKSRTFDTGAAQEFRTFLLEHAARKRRDIHSKMATTKVKEILEHQLAMLRLTRQMNQLLKDFPRQISPESSTERVGGTSKGKKKTTTAKKLRKTATQSKEYVIFSGGPKGLEYRSLTKSDAGTFRMEIDVSGYRPEDLQINTEDRKTMHVKGTVGGVRKTLKIISPEGVDIDDVIIHYPKSGTLVLEAP